ncbi:glycosyltransferase [Fundidesulfovibrio agrisoli]|uniref:glycosyltransferase n=1 Tax=Fundidesulfovibrio agrisoli TaxID=2922717 RepID=UPI001FAD9B32|nr:glycosyltransferase [Fundidesulfovibrio agrisoli]
MKILMVAHGMPPHEIGGTQLHTLDVALELTRRGHEVLALCPRRSRGGGLVFEEAQGLRVARLELDPPPPDRDAAAFALAHDNPESGRRFAEFLRAERPDIVHFHHFFDLSASLADAARREGIPALLTLHDLWLVCEQPHFLHADMTPCAHQAPQPRDCARCFAERRPGGALSRDMEALESCFAARREHLRRVVAGLDCVVSLAGFQEERLRRQGLAPRMFRRIPLGQRPLGPVARPRRAGGPLRLAYMGIVAPAKGLDVVFEALDILGWEGVTLDVHGIPCVPDYVERLQRAHPPGGAAWHGGYGPADLERILSAADAVVMPSRSENTPLVVSECLAARVPVAASDVGGVPEMLGFGRWGLLFANGDAQGLARAIRRMRGEPGLLESLAASIPRGKNVAEEAAELEALYRELAG